MKFENVGFRPTLVNTPLCSLGKYQGSLSLFVLTEDLYKYCSSDQVKHKSLLVKHCAALCHIFYILGTIDYNSQYRSVGIENLEVENKTEHVGSFDILFLEISVSISSHDF